MSLYIRLNADIFARDLMSDVLKLEKELLPKSPLHQAQDTRQLRDHVAQVKEMSCRFPTGTAREWEWDLEIAVKGIVQERKVVLKQPKPELVVEDDLFF